MRALAIVLLAGCGADAVTDGCASFANQTCISVEVRSGKSLQVDQIRLQAQSGFQFAPEPFLSPATPLSPAVSLPVVVPILPGSAFGGGNFSFVVSGMLAGVDEGDATVAASVAVGTHLRLVAVLNPPDGGPLDGGALPDLSLFDGPLPDLSVPTGDLAGADLTPGPDMGFGLPRPIAPVSTGFVTNNKPNFKWELGVATDGATVEICKDRACTVAVTSFDVDGTTTGAPAGALPAGVLYWRLHPRRAGVTLAGSGPTWEFTVTVAGTVNFSYGNLADFNGDGLADLAYGAVTAPAVNSGGPMPGAGRAYVFLGKKTAKVDWKAAVPSPDFNLIDPLATVGDNFGASVIGVGDLDGDGFADLAVGATGSNRVYLYRGGPSGLSAPNPTPNQIISAPGAPTSFGRAVAGADLDGDGYSDLVIGATGAVYGYRGGPALFAAPSPMPLSTNSGDSALGTSIANAGDIDGDGLGDVIIGDPNNLTAGFATIAFGRANGMPFIFNFQAVSLVNGDNFGAWVGGAGDVNGDGYSDVIVGAPQSNSGEGTAFVYYGSSTGLKPLTAFSSLAITPGSFGGETFGAAVAGTGDVNGDGFWDVVVSGPSYSPAAVTSAAGRAVVLLGPAPTGTGATPFTNGSKADLFGSSLKFVGDIDGDGSADVVIGTPNAGGAAGISSPSYYHGKVDVYFGGGALPATPDVSIGGPDGYYGHFGS